MNLRAASILAAFALVAAYARPSVADAATLVSGPRAIESLSPSERSSLPDATPLVVKGHATTLGALRGDHALLMSRFAGARNILAFESTAPPPALTEHCTSPSVAGEVAAGGTTTLVCRNAGLPPDAQAFCASSVTTLCVYLPAVNDLTQDTSATSASGVQIFDFILTDPSVCRADGGVSSPGVCTFKYPGNESIQYAAKQLPGVKVSSSQCAVALVVATDPYGSVGISFNFTSWNLKQVDCTVTATAATP